MIKKKFKDFNIFTLVALVFVVSYVLVKKNDVFMIDYSIINWIILYLLFSFMIIIVYKVILKKDHFKLQEIIYGILIGLTFLFPAALLEVYYSIAQNSFLSGLSYISLTVLSIIILNSLFRKKLSLIVLFDIVMSGSIFLSRIFSDSLQLNLTFVGLSLLFLLIGNTYKIYQNIDKFKEDYIFNIIIGIITIIFLILTNIYLNLNVYYVFSIVIFLIALLSSIGITNKFSSILTIIITLFVLSICVNILINFNYIYSNSLRLNSYSIACSVLISCVWIFNNSNKTFTLKEALNVSNEENEL